MAEEKYVPRFKTKYNDEVRAKLIEQFGYTNPMCVAKIEKIVIEDEVTDIICENCKYLPTKRTRNKRKPIPKESDVKTFNYTAHLWDIRWLRERARNTR